MLLKKVLQNAFKSRPLGALPTNEVPWNMRPANPSLDGEEILRRGDALLDMGNPIEAEATYRQAFGSELPHSRVYQKLKRVVTLNAQSFETPGKLMIPPGDGTASDIPTQDIQKMVDAVNCELATVPTVMPSKFWVSHADKHVSWLVKKGMVNFKRTVAHNYYNWVTTNIEDHQIARLLELWPLHGSSEPLADVMEDLNQTVRVKEFIESDAQRFYRLGVSLLWDYTLMTDNHGWLRQLAEPVTGNPIRIMRRDRLISQDLAHSVRERNTIVDASGLSATAEQPLMIAELGAGQGRLAHLFAMSTNCRYAIFDIAPALLVSQWYIKSLFPNEKIFTFRHFDSFDEIAEELSQCRFAFFASSQLEKFPQKHFDLFINVCSLMEMRLDTIDYFFREIDRVTRGFFYTKQWLEQNNREDGIVIRRDDYPIPRAWKRLFEGIDPINQRLFEEVWAIA